MNRKFIPIIIFSVIMLVCAIPFKVFAASQIDLYATCVYKDDAGGTRTVKITKKGLEITNVGSGYSGPKWRCNQGTTKQIKIDVSNYIKDDKYDCSLIQNIYEYSSSQIVDKQKAKCTVTVQKDKNDKSTASNKIFKYDASSSKVYVSSVSGATEDKKEEVKKDYDKVCSSSDAKVYISFDDPSKNKIDYNYDTSVCDNFTNNNIIKSISDNQYTCPIQMEIKKACHQGVCNCGLVFSYNSEDVKEDTIVTDELYTGNYTCGVIINFMQELESIKKDFNDDSIMKKQLRDKLKTYCSQIYKSLDVNSPTKCVQDCKSAIDEVQDLLDIKYDNSKCGFSEKLAIYIANIVKWLKYIIPVIVIVLGILDFIKAIASEKDDEMKKAQGHFVKRLIAAALIFIIPVIIEFILEKMGFDANGCGIIDL